MPSISFTGATQLAGYSPPAHITVTSVTVGGSAATFTRAPGGPITVSSPAVTEASAIVVNYEDRASNPATIQVLERTGVPAGVAPSGTVATNGTITLGTALQVIYSGGIWLYLPSTALAAPNNVAGWFWCVMSSTTVGTVRLSPSAPTILTGSNVGYTGVITEVNVDPLAVAIPGGLIGNGGALRCTTNVTVPNNANGKALRHKFGGVNIQSTAPASSLGAVLKTIVTARTPAQQIGFNDITAAGTTPTIMTVDTTVPQNYQIGLSMATATDYIVLESITLEYIPFA